MFDFAHMAVKTHLVWVGMRLSNAWTHQITVSVGIMLLNCVHHVPIE